MSLFERTISKIEQNSEAVERGEVLFIDMQPFFPKLSDKIPGFLRGEQVIVTANSGIGKSKLTRFMFIRSPIKLAQESNIKPRIFLNSLEETEEKVATSFILGYIAEKYGISMNFRDLHYPRTPHSDDLKSKIREGEHYYSQIETYLEVVRESNPFGFYKKIREYLRTNGKFYHIVKDQDGKIISKTRVADGDKWNHYEYDDPNRFVVGISDNINNYVKEQSMSWYETITKFSQYYSRNLLCNGAGCIMVHVQQQAADKEKIETNFKGQTIEQKLEPSLDGLGEIKITARDATVVLGLYAPNRYAITEYGGWNIRKLQDRYRAVIILKDREGEQSRDNKLSMYFNGGTEFFKELPDLSEANSVYQQLGV